MRVYIVAGKSTDITDLITDLTWSGDTKTAARKLEFTFIQSDLDENIPAVDVDCGYTVVAADDDGNLIFRGNIYSLEKDRAASKVKIVAFDNLYVLNKSKTTQKFSSITPEAIAKSICSQMGVKAGNIAVTNTPVSFIANSKSGYQIIQGAYYEAHKINGKIYQQIMRGDELDIIEKGKLSGVILDAAANMTGSEYKKSIENLINAVLIVDEQGNSTGEIVSDSESISQYSMILTTYKAQKDKDTQTEAKALLNKPEREGIVTALGDYRALAGYGLLVRDANFDGKFYIDSDVHNFSRGQHLMKLKLAFENLMQKEEVQKEKSK